MNLPDARVSQVCSSCIMAQRHHCQWVSSCYLGPQKEAVAEIYCSGFSFQEPEEQRVSFKELEMTEKARLSFIWGGASCPSVQLPELLITNMFYLCGAAGPGEISAALTPCCEPGAHWGNGCKPLRILGPGATGKLNNAKKEELHCLLPW